MRRRSALALSGALSAAAAWPLRAQNAAPPRLTIFLPGERSQDDIDSPFVSELRRLGWVHGRTIAIDWAYVGDRMERAQAVAAEVVARNPDVIAAISPVTAVAAKQATSTIPIVFTLVVDPLAAGLIDTYAHPGHNATGVTQTIVESLMPKRLQLLREVLPGIRRIGVLANPSESAAQADLAALRPLVSSLGLTMMVAEATDAAAFDDSVDRVLRQGAQAILPASSIAVTRRRLLVEKADARRVPVIGLHAPMALAGALFSYGPSFSDQLVMAAGLVDKVLRGTKPEDLPVQAADRFELIVNRASARRLGIALPQVLLLRADRVLE